MQNPFGTPDNNVRFINLPILRRISPEVFDRTGYSFNIYFLIIIFWFAASILCSAYLRLSTSFQTEISSFAFAYEGLLTNLIPGLSRDQSHLFSSGHSDLWPTYFVCIFAQILIVVFMLMTLALAHLRYIRGVFSKNDRAKLAEKIMSMEPLNEKALIGLRKIGKILLACTILGLFLVIFTRGINPALSPHAGVSKAINNFIILSITIPSFLAFRHFLQSIASVIEIIKKAREG